MKARKYMVVPGSYQIAGTGQRITLTPEMTDTELATLAIAYPGLAPYIVPQAKETQKPEAVPEPPTEE